MRNLMLLIALMSLVACFARGGMVGEQVFNLDAPVPNVHQAVLDCLRAENIAIEEESADMVASLVKGRYADGVLVTIHSERFTEKASRLTIQVGTFGDELRSGQLIGGIRSRLGQ
jgi:hypothetical protein